MTYALYQWPDAYPGELGKFTTVLADIDAALNAMSEFGPRPDGFKPKAMGKKNGGLWQISFRSDKHQVRILYAPYKDSIVIFLIHKKSSPQEQKRALALAQKRKQQHDSEMKCSGTSNVKSFSN